MGDMAVSSTRLRREFTSLGVRRGTVLLTHCSMRAIGWIEGGAATLLDALLDVLGEDGTLVAPTQSPSMSMTTAETRRALAGRSPRDRKRYLDSVPDFDPTTTPTEGMGALAEAIRTHPASRRSAHPTTSFAAIGRRANELTASHPHNRLLGDESPLGWMYREQAFVLLLGVGFDKCTAFHLGEDVSVSPRRSYRFKIGEGWPEVRDARDYDDSDFAELGAHFESAHEDEVRSGTVGSAACRLFPLAAAADFAAKWLPRARRGAEVLVE